LPNQTSSSKIESITLADQSPYNTRTIRVQSINPWTKCRANCYLKIRKGDRHFL